MSHTEQHVDTTGSAFLEEDISDRVSAGSCSSPSREEGAARVILDEANETSEVDEERNIQVLEEGPQKKKKLKKKIRKRIGAKAVPPKEAASSVKRLLPSPYETSAIRPTGLNPYIHLSMLKAEAKNKSMTGMQLQKKRVYQESHVEDASRVSHSDGECGVPPSSVPSVHHQRNQGDRSIPQLLPALGVRKGGIKGDQRKPPSYVKEEEMDTTTHSHHQQPGSCPLLQPLQKNSSPELALHPKPKAVSSSSSVKRLLKHFVSISRTVEDSCQALQSESLICRQDIESAESDRRRQIGRLYTPALPPSITEGRNEGNSSSSSRKVHRQQHLLPRGSSILGQVSVTHQFRTLGGLEHELVVVGLEEENARQGWESRLYGDLKAMHRACRRIASEIQLECDTRKLEEVKAMRAAQEEKEFVHRQSEATRQEHFGRQIRQLFLDESKIRFALEMEEYRSLTILQYSERENSSRAHANSQKMMDILRAEERTVFVFGLFQESFAEMERERTEELSMLRAQYLEQGTSLVLKYQARARAEIEGRESTVRDLRQIALCSTELHQLYLRSIEHREGILRDVVWEEEREARLPLEAMIANYSDDIRCSIGAVRGIVTDVVEQLLIDKSGVLSAIDLRVVREDIVTTFVKEVIAGAEKRIALLLSTVTLPSSTSPAPSATTPLNVEDTSVSDGSDDDRRRKRSTATSSLSNSNNMSPPDRSLDLTRGGKSPIGAANSLVGRVIESALIHTDTGYSDPKVEEEGNGGNGDDEEPSPQEINNIAASPTTKSPSSSSAAVEGHHPPHQEGTSSPSSSSEFVL